MTIPQAGIEAIRERFDEAEVITKDAASEGETQPIEVPFKICTAREILESDRQVQWVLYPYIEADATTLMSGEPGTLKSFTALDWACRAAAGLPAISQRHRMPPQRVLLISAEGKGLKQRLGGWLRHNREALDGDSNTIWPLIEENLRIIERPIDLSSDQTITFLLEYFATAAFSPNFIIVDTLTRNSSGNVEESNTAAQKFLNQLDRELRTRFNCAVLLIHHLGKDPGKGARGPSSLVANTEAEIIVRRPDPEKLSIIVEFGRVKDSEPPPPFRLDGKIVATRYCDGFGQPLTTLVMTASDGSIKFGPMQKVPVGKNQRKLLDALLAAESKSPCQSYSDEKVREIALAAGIESKRTSEAIGSLAEKGYLEALDGSHYRFNPTGTKKGSGEDEQR
jgi:hypothetical protein